MFFSNFSSAVFTNSNRGLRASQDHIKLMKMSTEQILLPEETLTYSQTQQHKGFDGPCQSIVPRDN